MNVVALSGTALAQSGADNLGRLRRALRRDAGAIGALRALGVGEAAIDRFHLGLKEPYRSRTTGLVIERALAFPIHARTGGQIGRYGYRNLEGVTTNPAHPEGWGPGDALSYYSSPASDGDHLVVVEDVATMWAMAVAVDAAPGDRLVLVTRSHCAGMPFEWGSSAYWSRWRRVTIASGHDGRARALADGIRDATARELFVATPPDGIGDWAALLAQNASGHEIRARIADAALVAPAPSREIPADRAVAGSFQAEPVSVVGAFVGGRMLYAVRVERRLLEAQARGVGSERRLVQEYTTLVLRSDGELLEAETLPAPRGTPASCRVVALSDGTRILGIPSTSQFGSWSFASIEGYVAAKRAGVPVAARSLARLLADIEAYLRSIVWLPDADAYGVAALYVAMSHVYRVFDAVPILHLHGERGSGKSELGQAIADLGFNSLLVGATSAAALVRLIDETRGLLVLDDLERVGGTVSGFGDISQILKTSYKASTARKAVADRSGRIAVLDFFGPKIVANIRGADEVLRSRMLRIGTRRMPADMAGAAILGLDADRSRPLRDELHCWGMDRAAEVHAAYRALITAAPPTDRQAEILAPLRALAAVAAEPEISARLERFAIGQTRLDAVADPRALVVGAVEAIVGAGGGADLSLVQVAMEAMLLAGAALPTVADSLLNPEFVGQQLLVAGVRDPQVPATRNRLYGHICRIYRLSARFSAPDGKNISTELSHDDTVTPRALAFCMATTCAACRYREVCDRVVPGLKGRKNRLHPETRHPATAVTSA